MLDERKSAILRKVVEEHIETGQPVGSVHVVRDPAVDVSPATVRADMAALERDGYLTHPHTSAGRVPTDLGYRYFVDNLDLGPVLDPAREERVEEFFARAHGALERMLLDTSRLLAGLTDYAAVVVGPPHDALTIRSALLTRVADRLGLFLLVLSNGAVEKLTVDLAVDIADSAIDRANTALREQLAGRPLGVRRERLTATGEPEVDRVLETCWLVLSGHLSEVDPGEVYVGGASHMAEQFEAVNTVREVLFILEQSLVVVSLLSDTLARTRSVAIGAETGVDSLSECSLVVAPYEVGDEVVGAIGVLGPTRMNYSQALAAVAVVSERLGRQLTSG